MVWLRRGDLSEAEADLHEAIRLAEFTRFGLVGPIATAFLAETALEQGRVETAESLVCQPALTQPLPAVGPFFFLLQSRARVLRARGRHEDALHTALAAGQRFAAHGGHNPAMVAWRSEAALCLHALDRDDEAREYAYAELDLARCWKADYALGHALRIAGLLTPAGEGLKMLLEAINVLTSSPARLELAKALTDFGAALRRLGNCREPRPHLRRGIELAQICGAEPLVERGWTELRATGARPRHVTLSGPDALTPSERRVAELAAAGYSNRDIAQSLFITTNTVEVHLTRGFRKLGITSRTSLKYSL
jgi:DNA-binding CsgD family transcriptional regulator